MGTLIKGKGRVRVLCDVARKLSFWPCTPPRRERNRGYKRMDEKGIVSYIWLCILYDVVVLFEWFYGFFFFFCVFYSIYRYISGKNSISKICGNISSFAKAYVRMYSLCYLIRRVAGDLKTYGFQPKKCKAAKHDMFKIVVYIYHPYLLFIG